jgi:hypothetical protein
LTYQTKLPFAFLQLASGSFLSNSRDNAKIQPRLVKDANTGLMQDELDRGLFEDILKWKQKMADETKAAQEALEAQGRDSPIVKHYS